ncbi:hypothetical protein CLOP_g17255 [Closterium sp. NIES-67]|nr:hypothetical protein CLOP_g17255 [Closterium sp. NIES-67]
MRPSAICGGGLASLPVSRPVSLSDGPAGSRITAAAAAGQLYADPLGLVPPRVLTKRLLLLNSRSRRTHHGFPPNRNKSSSVHVSGRDRLFLRVAAQSRHLDWVENTPDGDNGRGNPYGADKLDGGDNVDRGNPYGGRDIPHGPGSSYGGDSRSGTDDQYREASQRADGRPLPVIPHDVAKALVDSLAKAHESSRESDDAGDNDFDETEGYDNDHAKDRDVDFDGYDDDGDGITEENDDDDDDVMAEGKGRDAAPGESSDHPARFESPVAESAARLGRLRSSEEESTLSSWSWPAESVFAESASTQDSSSVAAGGGEATVRQLAFNGWSSDVVRVSRPGPLAAPRKASIAKPLLLASLLCGAALLYRGAMKDRCFSPLQSHRDTVTTVSVHKGGSSQVGAKEGDLHDAGTAAAGGEAAGERGEEQRGGETEEVEKEVEVKEGREAVGGRKEQRIRVVVAPHVNPEHARMLEGLKALQVIDADVAAAGICTRREFATWLMAFSERLRPPRLIGFIPPCL